MLKYLLQKEIFFMDFETSFLKYKEELTIENEKLGKKKAYKTILKIKHLFFFIGLERKMATREINKLKTSLFLNEMQERITLSKVSKQLTPDLPVGINRKIVALMEEETLYGYYANLLLALNDILTSYYKSKSSNVSLMSILEALIEITTDCYINDQEEYQKYFKQLEQDLEQNKISSLKHIGTYKELESFIIQILCNEEIFDFKGFQSVLLKKF